ncbi:MAG: molybdenum cofactor guanylyltransferase [Acidimicrobiales bacterium]
MKTRPEAGRGHLSRPAVGGLLLTGGRSLRMGRDKAKLEVGGELLAVRLGRLLAEVARPALEVGPGWSGLVTSRPDPGEGPLAAIASGWLSLRERGEVSGVIVIATDLPWLTGELLAWIAARQESSSVVPVVDGRIQPLCARWSPADLDSALALVDSGERAVSSALGRETAYLDETEWGRAACPLSFADVDSPEDLGRHPLQ